MNLSRGPIEEERILETVMSEYYFLLGGALEKLLRLKTLGISWIDEEMSKFDF
jgi:hypothetical protein